MKLNLAKIDLRDTGKHRKISANSMRSNSSSPARRIVKMNIDKIKQQITTGKKGANQVRSKERVREAAISLGDEGS